MKPTDYLVESLIESGTTTQKEFDELVDEYKKQSPVTQLQEENEQLKKRVESSEGALLGLMDILMGGM